MPVDRALEAACRAAAFTWLEAQVAREGDVLSAALLRLGFPFHGQNVPLAVQQGIHKPRFLAGALSLRTALGSPYRDAFDGPDALLYRYRGTDPEAWDNRAARVACEYQLPLVYLHEIPAADKRYLALWPTYIVSDDPLGLTFRLQTEPAQGLVLRSVLHAAGTVADQASVAIERRYATVQARRRLHQATFRGAVLRAYASCCAMCRLKHEKLLDAAHIIPDSDPDGEPRVQNGISLCRIHHAAFDLHYLSIEPDSHRIRVRRDLLEEHDGPMLRHGLQALESQPLILPRRPEDRPDPEHLRRHFKNFLAAS